MQIEWLDAGSLGDHGRFQGATTIFLDSKDIVYISESGLGLRFTIARFHVSNAYMYRLNTIWDKGYTIEVPPWSPH